MITDYLLEALLGKVSISTNLFISNHFLAFWHSQSKSHFMCVLTIVCIANDAQIRLYLLVCLDTFSVIQQALNIRWSLENKSCMYTLLEERSGNKERLKKVLVRNENLWKNLELI